MPPCWRNANKKANKKEVSGCSHRVITSVTRRDVGRRCHAPDRRSGRIPVVFFTPSLRPFVKND